MAALCTIYWQDIARPLWAPSVVKMPSGRFAQSLSFKMVQSFRVQLLPSIRCQCCRIIFFNFFFGKMSCGHFVQTLFGNISRGHFVQHLLLRCYVATFCTYSFFGARTLGKMPRDLFVQPLFHKIPHGHFL